MTIRAGTSGVSPVTGGAARGSVSCSAGGMPVLAYGGEQATAHMAVAAEEQRALNGNGEGKSKAGTNTAARAGVVREKLHLRLRVSTAQDFSVNIAFKESSDVGPVSRMAGRAKVGQRGPDP